MLEQAPDCPLSADEQIERLQAIACQRGWAVVHIFTDRPISVRKGQDRRPGEVALIDLIRRGAIDRVLIWSIDRVGRSLIDLVAFMEACRTAGVSLWLDEQSIGHRRIEWPAAVRRDAMLAFHLRQTRRDRILRGQAAARSLSIRFGRPPMPRPRWRRPGSRWPPARVCGKRRG